jgi:TolA-binding protein
MRSAAEGKTYAVATDPWYPELLYTVAVLYGEMGMHEAAIAAHREVSILFSETPWATQSLKALEITTPEVSTL